MTKFRAIPIIFCLFLRNLSVPKKYEFRYKGFPFHRGPKFRIGRGCGRDKGMRICKNHKCPFQVSQRFFPLLFLFPERCQIIILEVYWITKNKEVTFQPFLVWELCFGGCDFVFLFFCFTKFDLLRNLIFFAKTRCFLF